MLFSKENWQIPNRMSLNKSMPRYIMSKLLQSLRGKIPKIEKK